MAAAVAACTAAPEPPPTPEAVVQLSQRYDRPTARLDADTARRLVDVRLRQRTLLEVLAGLTFVRDVIRDATRIDTADAVLGIDVQGSLAVHAPCPGWDHAANVDEAETGFVDLLIGVEASRVQRAFTGEATGCRFIARHGSLHSKASVSVALELDLGGSLGLGEPVPSLLLRVSELSTEIADGFGELDLDDVLDEVVEGVSLRVGNRDLLETLVDLASFDIGLEGTCLLALRDDGSIRVRASNGAWVCSSERSDPCVRAD